MGPVPRFSRPIRPYTPAFRPKAPKGLRVVPTPVLPVRPAAPVLQATTTTPTPPPIVAPKPSLVGFYTCLVLALVLTAVFTILMTHKGAR